MRSAIPFMLLIASCLAACPGTPPGDAGADASCGVPRSPRVFLTTSSVMYDTGDLAVLGLGSTPCVRDAIAPISSDAVLAFHGPQLVVMNSGNGPGGPEDNVTFFDVSAPIPRVSCQLAATGAAESGSADPRGYVAVDAQRGYLARFAKASLAIIDTATCSITGFIDLAPFRADAPLPDPRPIARVGTEVWVALERLPATLMNPTTPGAIVRIDPSSDSPIDNDAAMTGVQPIELHHPNPVGRFAQSGTHVWIASVGAYQAVGDGAIEEIDTVTRAVIDAASEMDLGGNVDAVIVLDDDRLLARVASQAVGSGLNVSDTRLVEWRRSTRTARTWVTVSDYALTEPVLGSDGRVYVGDRGNEVMRRPSAVRVFEASTGTEVNVQIMGPALPPYDLAVE